MDTLIPLTLVLTQVTVYPQGGTYRYTGMLSAPRGLTTFVWEGLPQQTDPSTVRVIIPSSARGYVTQTSIEPVTPSTSPLPPDLVHLRSRIDSIESALARVKHRLAILALQEKTLTDNSRLGGEEGQVSSMEVEKYLSLVERRLSLILEEKFPLQKRERTLSDTLALLKEVYDNRLRGFRDKRSALFISYYAPQAEVVPIRVELFGPEASWALSYRIRVTPAEGKIIFQRWASVQNSSGEDWRDAQVILSTGTPDRSGQMPPFQPWYVDVFTPVMPMTKIMLNRQNSEETEGSATGASAEESAEESSSSETIVPISVDQTVSRAYDLGRQRILAGTRPSRFFLAADTLLGSLRFFINAAAEEAAYLRAGLSISTMKLWESAPATIEVDGQEVARIQWPPTLSEDTLWLDLGRSPFVQVKRTQIRDVKETRPIGNMIHRRFTYTLRVSHTYNAPISLTIWDRIPVSRHSDIKVEVTEAAGGTLDSERGQLSWQVTLAPGETWTRTFSFVVKYPKQKTVIGL
ncbi:MAG: DUF4139 domain-containing protein [Bacteroidia bacterium]